MREDMEHYEVAVLGCGGMGSAACRHLAARGVNVVGLEQFGRLHDHGSSHGHSRVVRQAYFEHPDYVPLLKRSFQLWDELAEESGMPCLLRIGALFAGPADSEVYAGSLRSAREHELAIQELDHKTLCERYPQFAFDSDTVGVFEPTAGLVIPENGIAAHLELAERDGADIRENIKVESVETSDTGIVVRTSSGSLRAERLVVTAGAWTSRFISCPGMPLEVHRKVFCWFEPLDLEACDSARMPVWIIGGGRSAHAGDYYGIPTWVTQPGPRGVKVGFHGPGTIVDPDTCARTVPEDVIARFRHDIHELLPGVLGEVMHSTTCLYTMSPDGHFIVDHAPGDERVVLGCGFSGHGYKFAPVIGEILADLAIDGVSSLPVEFLGLGPRRV